MSQLKALPLLILFGKFVFMKEKREIFTNERKTGDLKDISGVLMPLARKLVGKKAFAEADVICNWCDIAGSEIATYSRPIKIDFKKDERVSGTLFIETYGGAFALELQAKSKFLIDKVNVFFVYQAVSNIKIVQNSKHPDVIVQDVIKPQKMLVSEEEENYIEEVSNGLKSNNLEDALKRLGRAVFNHNKKRDNNV